VKLTLEEDRGISRWYGHIKAAPVWRRRCGRRLAGTSRTCTREANHGGPHVAHGRLRKIVAVWDGGTPERRPKSIEKRTRRTPGTGRSAGPLDALKALGRRIRERPQQYMEEALLLVFVLAMAGFVLDWALRILGVR
jgi:hypothetical protein